jgi:hypothetical protein
MAKKGDLKKLKIAARVQMMDRNVDQLSFEELIFRRCAQFKNKHLKHEQG